MTTQTIDREDLRERVLKGASLLDEVNPGWRDQIDKDRLNIDSLEDCILGQLYGWYSDGLISLWEKEDEAFQPEPFEYGFASKCDGLPLCTCGKESAVLTEIWKEII